MDKNVFSKMKFISLRFWRVLFFGCLLAILPFFMSCSVALKGNYSSGIKTVETDTDYDVVWDNIIDYFAETGIPIEILDKASGLIVSKDVSFNQFKTLEIKGKLCDPNAYIVYVAWGATKCDEKIIGTIDLYGNFNVRIRKMDGKTKISVNLLNLRHVTHNGGVIPVNPKQTSSTGVFEDGLIEMFQKK